MPRHTPLFPVPIVTSACGSGDIRVEHEGLSGAETRTLISVSLLVAGCGLVGLFTLILSLVGSSAVVAVYDDAGTPLALGALLVLHVPLLSLLTLVLGRSFEALVFQPTNWSRRSIICSCHYLRLKSRRQHNRSLPRSIILCCGSTLTGSFLHIVVQVNHSCTALSCARARFWGDWHGFALALGPRSRKQWWRWWEFSQWRW